MIVGTLLHPMEATESPNATTDGGGSRAAGSLGRPVWSEDRQRARPRGVLRMPSPSDRGPMRIGVIASIAHRLPPTGYGPWEQIASTLTEGFVARGHDVTLFATADSRTTARLIPTAPAGYEEDRTLDAKVCEALHNAAVFERADEFDVLANHFDFMPLTYSRLVTTPMVTTIHGFSSATIVPVYQAYDDIAHYVAISDADRHPDLDYAATIHHGIDLEPVHLRPERRWVPAVPRPDPPRQGHPPARSRWPGGRTAPGDRRDRPGRGVLPGRVRAAPRTGPVTYVGPVGPGERDRLLGGAARPAPPDQLRRALRPVRRRGPGHRHAGDRDSAGLDARAAARRPDRFPRQRCGVRCHRGPAAWPRSTGLTAAQRRSTGSVPAG